MGKVMIATLWLLAGLLWGQSPSDPLGRCMACHSRAAPPLSFVYRHYLALYSAQDRIEERMLRFLAHPSAELSSIPEGMKRRFDPAGHPAFAPALARSAVEALIRREDPIPKIVVKDRNCSATPADRAP
ncbi:hypothetical protein [Nitratifractor sp.]